MWVPSTPEDVAALEAFREACALMEADRLAIVEECQSTGRDCPAPEWCACDPDRSEGFKTFDEMLAAVDAMRRSG